MPDLVLKSTGKPMFVPPERLADALASGMYEAPAGSQAVPVELRPGVVGETTIGELGTAQAGGATPESETSFRGRERGARIEREHGGTLGKIGTAIEGGLQEATLGGFGALADVVAGDQYTEGRLERAEANPISSGIGRAAGILGTTIGSGGTSLGAKVAARTPLGAVARLGARIAEGGGIRRAVLAGGVEGTLMGAGQGVQELTDSADPLTLEHAVSAIGSNMFYGGVAGGAIGGAGKLVERGLVRAKSALEGISERAGAAAAGDVGAMKAAAVDDVIAYRQAVKEANPWLVIDEGQDAAKLTKANRSLRSALDTPKALSKNPGSLLKPLEAEEQALAGALARREEIVAKLGATNTKIARGLSEELATLPERATTVELTGKAARRYASFADVKLPKGGALSVARDDASAFLGALERGEVHGASEAAFGKLEGLLEENRALQARIGEAIAPAKAQGESFGQKMLGGTVYGAVAGAARSIPLVGGLAAPLLGAAASDAVTGAVFGRLGKAISESAARGAKTVQAFLDVTRKVTPAAPMIASKVLSEVRFAVAEPKPREKKEKKKVEPTLAQSYRARSEEIRSQTAYGIDGVPVMRPEARVAMAKNLAPIAAKAPMVADQMETIAARRIEYLSSVLPRRPDYGGVQMGPDRWQPSDMEMRTFARQVAAVEDPHGVMERVAAGTVSPSEVEAMKAVYPELHADMVRQILEQLPTLKKRLPYAKRLALSIFTGVPIDPAMHPQILRVLQDQYAQEPETEGGTQAPTPQPAFGSVSAAPGTKAQSREQGAM